MKRFEAWEKTFILLTYPTMNPDILANHLNRSVESVRSLIKRLKIRKVHRSGRRTYTGTVSGKMHGWIRRRAKRRGVPFNLTLQFMENLLYEQNYKCSLTGLSIEIDTRKINKVSQNTTASLDRIDSSKGYVKGNVQWVHVDINYMKQRFGQEYFIEMCTKVAEKNKRKPS